jgi:hypothetical protein
MALHSSHCTMPEEYIVTPEFLYDLKDGEEAWVEPDALMVGLDRVCHLFLGAECVRVVLDAPGSFSTFDLRRHAGQIETALNSKEAQARFRYTVRAQREGEGVWRVDLTVPIMNGHKWRRTDFKPIFDANSSLYVMPSQMLFREER